MNRNIKTSGEYTDACPECQNKGGIMPCQVCAKNARTQTSASAYIVTRDLKMGDHPCGYSSEDMKIGDKVYLFRGPTYGCIGNGVAVSRNDGDGPFFELPFDALQNEDESWNAMDQEGGKSYD